MATPRRSGSGGGGGGGGSVTQLTAGAGVILTPNPIVAVGTISTSWARVFLMMGA